MQDRKAARQFQELLDNDMKRLRAERGLPEDVTIMDVHAVDSEVEIGSPSLYA